MNTKAFILTLTLAASPSAFGVCTTFTCMPDVDEHHEVTGSRIPGYLFASEQSVQFKQLAGGGGGGGGGAAPSAETVNKNGKKKAEKAKAEEAEGSNFFSNAFSSALKTLGFDFSLGVKVHHTTKPDGEQTTDVDGCLQVSRASGNKHTCTRTDAVKRPDGKHVIEIKKLISKQDSRGRWRLVYSTDDTMTFLVDNPQEVIDIFRSIDPTL